MHYYSNSFGYQPSSSNTNSWDPDTVLHLIHPARGAYKCTGYAPSKNRRCMNQVASFGSGRAILSSLAQKDVTEAVESPALEEAAGFTLCYLHKSQAHTVSQQWSRRLRAWASENEKDTRKSSSSKTESDSSFKHTSKPHWASGDAKMKEEDSENEGFANAADALQWKSIQAALTKLNMSLTDLTVLLKEMYKAKQQQEKAKREQEAREEEERSRQEQARREQAARDDEKRDRKAREAQAEASRERVRLAKERRDREAQERAAREADAWAHAWKRYTKAWDKIKTVKSEEFSEAGMPWPVKSGLYMDVDVANIRLFFKKAPPEDLVRTGEMRYKLINAENRKWHTDKIMQLFGPDVVSGKRKETFDTISKVMIQLRQEAQTDRRH